MRVLTGSLDHGHDVCGAQAAGNWTESRVVSSYASLISRRRTTSLTAPSCGRYSLASEYHRRL